MQHIKAYVYIHLECHVFLQQYNYLESIDFMKSVTPLIFLYLYHVFFFALFSGILLPDDNSLHDIVLDYQPKCVFVCHIDST